MMIVMMIVTTISMFLFNIKIASSITNTDITTTISTTFNTDITTT